MSRALSRVTVFVLLAGSAAVSSTPAHAYKMGQEEQPNTSGWTLRDKRVSCDDPLGFVHWNTRNITWRHNTSGQGAGKAAPLQDAMLTWTNVANSNYTLTYGTTTTTHTFGMDGVNSLSWGQNSACDSLSCHALTGLVLQSGQVIVEADIVFNSNPTLNLQWVTSGPYDPCDEANRTNNRVDVQAIATHELGHTLGIHHPDTSDSTYAAATMGGSSCNVDGRDLHADDLAALQCAENRYPYNPSYEGYHEDTNCGVVSGWAWNSNRPNDPSYVQIKEGSQVIGVAAANILRPDLQSAGKGNGVHGFSWSPNSSTTNLRDGLLHTLTVQHTGTNGNLSSTVQSLVCDASMFYPTYPSFIIGDTAGQPYTVATDFSSSKSGYITDLYFFKAKDEAGDANGQNEIRLWNATGSQVLATRTVTSTCTPATGTSGKWCGGPISPWYFITAGTHYRVGVTTYTKQAKANCGLSSPITKGSLTAHTSYWIAGSNTFPTTNSCSNYFVDVRFSM